MPPPRRDGWARVRHCSRRPSREGPTPGGQGWNAVACEAAIGGKCRGVGDARQARGSRNEIDVLVVGLCLPDIGEIVDALKASRLNVDRAESPDRVAHDVVGGRPDVVIVDLRISDDGDGLPDRILSWVCRNSSASALVITDVDQAEARIRALELGAADHIVAPLDVRESVARVDRLLAQRRKGRSGRIDVGDMTIDPAQRTAVRNGELVTFTP